MLAGLVGDPITKKYPKVSTQINEIGIQNSFQFLKLLAILNKETTGLVNEQQLGMLKIFLPFLISHNLSYTTCKLRRYGSR